MARPTVFDWDSSNTNVDVPPGALIASGWHDGDIPPAGFVNWAWRSIAQNLDYLISAPPVYSNLPEALADNTADGDTFIVDEVSGYPLCELNDTKSLPGAASAYPCIDVCSTGARMVVFELGASAAYCYARPYTDSVSVLATYTKTSAGTNVRCITDGTYTILAYGTHVECFNATTGASIWDNSHTATVADIAFLGKDYVVLVGNRTAGNVTMRIYALTDGASAATFDHGDHLYAVAVHGYMIYVGGATSSFASGARMRALRWTGGTLKGFDTECGLTADTTGKAWDVVGTDDPAPRAMCTNGRLLFVGYNTGAAYAIEVRSFDRGILQRGVYATTIYNIGSLRCDQDYVIAAFTDPTSSDVGSVHVFDVRTQDTLGRYLAAAGISIYVAETDGARIFFGREIAAAGQSLGYLYRGNRPQLFRRVDAYATALVESFGPWRTWLHRPGA